MKGHKNGVRVHNPRRQYGWIAVDNAGSLIHQPERAGLCPQRCLELPSANEPFGCPPGLLLRGVVALRLQNNKGRTRRLRAYLVLLYCLGLSHRGVEQALAPLGVHVDHLSVWRDLQELGARMQARGPGGPVRVAMLDETWIPIGGEKRPVAVVTDAADGTLLQLAVSDGAFDWQAWLAPLAGWGVEVVVTDDDSSYGGPLEAHGLDRQQCLVHMRRTFTRRLRKLPEEVRECYAPRLKRLRTLLRELPAEGAAILMGWLEEAVAPAAPAPKEWRSLVQHFLERWNQMRIHGRASDVPATTNRLEGRFGRLKPWVCAPPGPPPGWPASPNPTLIATVPTSSSSLMAHASMV